MTIEMTTSGERVGTEHARDVRTRLGISRERMAFLLGVTSQTIGRWESGSSRPAGLYLDVYIALHVALVERRCSPVVVMDGILSGRAIFLRRLFCLAYVDGGAPATASDRDGVPIAYLRGAKDAAEIADGYNAVTMHDHRIGDCVLAKLNLRRAAPRRNADRVERPELAFLRGLATGLLQMHGRLARGADATGVVRACEPAGVGLADLRRAGVLRADLARLRRAGVRERAHATGGRAS